MSARSLGRLGCGAAVLAPLTANYGNNGAVTGVTALQMDESEPQEKKIRYASIRLIESIDPKKEGKKEKKEVSKVLLDAIIQKDVEQQANKKDVLDTDTALHPEVRP
jgi:hypothetical protein